MASELWPLTKVRLTVIQWMPMSGSYERWDALSGDYMVSEEGAVPLPVIGSISALGKSSDQIAGEIAIALKGKLGLVTAPETSVEVIAYPPVYVVGAVAVPGAFAYQPGMTVLQAFALGGGMRAEEAGSSADRLGLIAELRGLEDKLLRARARMARLSTEIAGSQTIVFPKEVTESLDTDLADRAMQEEQTILTARERELERQATSLAELEDLLNQEIETLRTRMVDIESAIGDTETELAGVQSLVEKGLATVSRQSDLERTVADLRFDRLTQTTAVLRAQQVLNQAHREAAQLEDTSHTKLVVDLQEEQAGIEQMLLQQATAQRLLLDVDVAPQHVAGASAELAYAIVRQGQDGPVELLATETTAMLPGDVLKVGAIMAMPSDSGQLALSQATELAQSVQD